MHRQPDHKNIIRDVKIDVLNKFQTDLEKVWNEGKGLALAQQKKRRELQEEYDAKFAAYLSQGGLESAYSGQLKPTEEELRDLDKKAAAEHHAEFKRLWSGIANKLAGQLDIFNPQTILKVLVEKHPWLISPPSTISTRIISNFLYFILYNAIYNCSAVKFKDDNEFHETLLRSSDKLSWGNINQNWLEEAAEGYPFSDLRNFYFSSYPDTSYDPTLQASKSLNHQLHHIDLIRFLAHSYPVEMQRNISERPRPQIAPKHFEELKHLTQDEWKNFETLLINIRPQGKPPLWITLHKNRGKWDAYIPPFTTASEIRSFITGKQITVNYEENSSLNDIERLELETQWHAVLLARVLPALRSGAPIKHFRNDVPLSVLMQEVFEQSIGSDASLVTRSFQQCQPFSDVPLEHLLRSPSSTISKLLTNPVNYTGKELLNDFDARILVIESKDKKEYQLVVNANRKKEEVLTKALIVTHHNPKISYLQYPGDISMDARRSVEEKRIIELFTYNIHLRTIIPVDAKISNPYPLHCAARNRFLAAVAPEYLAELQKNPLRRIRSWSIAGSSIIDFFQVHGKTIDISFIEKMLKFKEAWRKANCDHSFEIKINHTQWQFMQIGEMGMTGLDIFFDQLNTRMKTQSLNFPITFDLSGSLGEKSDAYIKRLTQKITENKDCTLLFNNVSLILPKPCEPPALSALVDLITLLAKTENREIRLYNLDFKDDHATHLINQLEKLVEQEKFITQIVIPAWDQAAPIHKTEGELKARYRAIQNKILNNQRIARQPELKTNTQNIAPCIEGTLDPELKLEEKIVLRPQPWPGDNFTLRLPFTAQIPGVQQQLQQNAELQQELEEQKEQQQEQEQEQEQEQKIDRYKHDESLLITRDGRNSIDVLGKDFWDMIPETTKRLSGWSTGESLKKLFSLWVGSETDAQHVICRIEPQALQEIMRYASKHRFGLNKDNLPPGFYLAYSSDTSLILCFDKKRQAADLEIRKQLALKKRNPFTVQTLIPKPAIEFKGDYRQFTPITDNPDEQQTLWHFLATEDQNEIRIKSAREALISLLKKKNQESEEKERKEEDIETTQEQQEDEPASVILQRFNATQEIKHPLDRKACLNILTNWAKINGASEELQDALFNPTNKSTCLTDRNLKALGQLFNHFDIKKNHEEKAEISAETQGSVFWLRLADQIFKTFCKGPLRTEPLRIWIERILDPSQNWTECLDKEEVDAVVFSIATLKESQDHAEIWWQLVDLHGKAIGHMRYSELWGAYSKILSYLKNNDLEINKQALLNFFKKINPENASNPDFNGQVFLDRLYQVLKNAEKEPFANDIQQDILNNIDKIDWRHTGYYYASQYRSYTFWDPNLELSELKSSVAEAKQAKKTLHQGYAVPWDQKLSIEKDKAVLHALRFANQRMRLSRKDFVTFQEKVKSLPKGTKDFSNRLRLFTASLAVGIDQIDQLEAKEIESTFTKLDRRLISFLNSLLLLDGQLQRNSWQMYFADILVFVQTLEAVNLLDDFLKLSPPSEALEFINSCGRALQYLQRPRDDAKEDKDDIAKMKFQRLLKFVKEEDNFSHPLLTDYPWLIDELKDDASTYQDPYLTIRRKLKKPVNTQPAYRQLKIIREQLRSIQFAHCKFFPSQKELSEAFQAIVAEEKSGEPAMATKRQEIIQQWIDQGCAITQQDAPFCKIKELKEIKYGHQTLGGEQLLKVVHLALEKRLKPAFKKMNLQLFDKLISDHLAIDTSQDAKDQIEKFLDLLARLDNKAHYNELGQLLGALISKAAFEGQKRYYSLPQLMIWLETLLPSPDIYKARHYPADLLDVVLTDCIQKNSTLLNQNLNRLYSKINNTDLQKQIQVISQTDLPNQYKPILVKLALNYPNKYVEQGMNFLHDMNKNNADPNWMKAFSELVVFWAAERPRDSKNEILLDLATFSTFSEKKGNQDHIVLAKLWQNSQTKLIHWLVKKKVSLDEYKVFCSDVVSEKNNLIRMILIQAFDSKEPDIATITALKGKLQSWDEDNLRLLACYFATHSMLKAATLNRLLDQRIKNADQLIHHFETVEQGTDQKTSLSKRNYDIDKKNDAHLARIIGGLKRKGQAGPIPLALQKQLLNLVCYLNKYSQFEQLEKLDFTELKARLMIARQELQTAQEEDKPYAAARLLACMREILLRKSGKWVKDTQMIDLIYAALHPNDNLLHQLRTGQGKSIISMMRAGYLALNGKIVDVFSAKNALSKRDHKDATAFLEALGIRHAHITASSDLTDYHDKVTRDGIGAVNFATPGNFSLFISGKIWENQGTDLILDPTNRVAFLDECDQILRREKTQFNCPTKTGGDSIYNLDEWVYRATYEFYLELLKKNKDSKSDGLEIKRNPDLIALCQHLQEQSKIAPKQSNFIAKYLFPALTGDPEAIKKRDEELTRLLRAANIAQQLKEGRDYAIQPDHRNLSGGLVIITRFGKVLIDNQVQEGSTYSDLVHQFLHVRLNKEAIDKGQSPNFFVDPPSQIVLSQNVTYLMKHYYRRLEGCSGTAGNRSDLEAYRAEFKIDHVIKVPTHEEIKTEFKPTLYCDTKEEYINAIVKQIVENPNRPILVTCQDDIAVKEIARLVKQKLRQNQDFKFDDTLFYVDTNDTGAAEEKIVAKAGKVGAITFSSRLGRGTDIKPKGDLGLMVVRTYPAIPGTVKQEIGRQGRNGDPGCCIDIINYAPILEEYKKFSISREYKDELNRIFTEETQHLDEKLGKNKNKTALKWQHIEKGNTDYTKYLITRSVVRLKHEIKQRQEQPLRQKELLIATLSGEIMSVLQKNPPHQQKFKEDWLTCRQAIDAAWDARKEDQPDFYQTFSRRASLEWRKFCRKYEGLLKEELLKTLEEKTVLEAKMPEKKAPDEKGELQLPAAIDLQQEWCRGAQTAYFDEKGVAQTEVIHEVYAPAPQGLQILYQVFKTLSAKQGDSSYFPAVAKWVKQPSFYSINCQVLAGILEHGLEIDDRHQQIYIECLDTFFKLKIFKKTDPYQPGEIRKYTQLLQLVVSIFEKSSKDKKILDLITHLCTALYEKSWDKCDDQMIKALQSIFASDTEVTDLLIQHIDRVSASDCILLIKQQLNHYPGSAQDKINLLVTHLKKNQKDLNQTPRLIKPLFHLAMGEAPIDDDVRQAPNYLPQLDELKQWTTKLKGEFYHFLTRRMPIQKDIYNRLMQLINRPEPEEKFEDTTYHDFLSTLFALPPFVSLAFLVKQLEPCLGEYNETEVKLGVITEIDIAGKAFKNFLTARNLISKSSAALPDQKQKEQLQTWINCFEQMSIQQNQIFFETACSFVNLAPATLLALADSFRKGKITNDNLRKCFQFADHLGSLPPHSKLQDYFQARFLEKIQSMDDVKSIKESIERFDRFVKLTQIDATVLEEQEIVAIYTFWERNPNELIIQSALAVLEKFRAWRTKAEFNSLYRNYLQNISPENNQHQHYLNFFNILGEPRQWQDDELLILLEDFKKRDFENLKQVVAILEKFKVLHAIREEKSEPSAMAEYINTMRVRYLRKTSDLKRNRRYLTLLELIEKNSHLPVCIFESLVTHIQKSPVLSIQQLQEAGEYFNKFLQARKLTDDSKHAPPSELKLWTDFFKGISIDQNRIFFKITHQYARLDQATLVSLAEAFRKGELSDTDLEQCCQLADQTRILQQANQRDFVQVQLLKQLREGADSKSVQNLYVFMQILKDNPVELTDHEIDTIFSYLDLDNGVLLIKDALAIFAKIGALQRKVGDIKEHKEDKEDKDSPRLSEYKYYLDIANRYARLDDSEMVNELVNAIEQKELKSKAAELENFLQFLDRLPEDEDGKIVTLRTHLQEFIQALRQAEQATTSSFLIRLFFRSDPGKKLIKAALDNFNEIAQMMQRLCSEKEKKDEQLSLHMTPAAYLANLRKAYFAQPISTDRNQRYLHFLGNLDDNEDIPMSVCLPLSRAYLDEKPTIHSNSQLQKAFGVVRDALTLQEQKNYGDLFSNLNNNAEKRQALMQHLDHGLIDLGTGFRDTCYDQYRDLALKPIEEPHLIPDEKREERTRWHIRHREIVKMANEIVEISKDPYPRIEVPDEKDGMEAKYDEDHDPESSDGSIHFRDRKRSSSEVKSTVIELSSGKQREYERLIDRNKTIYRGFWFKSDEREQQANALFSTLEEQKAHTGDKTKFYQSSLKVIWQAEKKLLESDSKYDKNRWFTWRSRNYFRKRSRLFDTMVEMFTKLAADFLADRDIDPKQKAKLFKEMLSQQLPFTIDLLHDRLPNGHALKRSLQVLKDRASKSNPWHHGSTELANLSSVLDGVDRDGIPKQLHYLLDFLNCFVDRRGDKTYTMPSTR